MALRASRCPYRRWRLLSSRRPRKFLAKCLAHYEVAGLGGIPFARGCCELVMRSESLGCTDTLVRWSGALPVSTVMTRAAGSQRSPAVTARMFVTGRLSNFERGCWRRRDGGPGWERPLTVRSATVVSCRRVCRLSGQVLCGTSATCHQDCDVLTVLRVAPGGD